MMKQSDDCLTVMPTDHNRCPYLPNHVISLETIHKYYKCKNITSRSKKQLTEGNWRCARYVLYVRYRQKYTCFYSEINACKLF